MRRLKYISILTVILRRSPLYINMQKKCGLQYEYDEYLTRVLSCYTGKYKYSHYEILPIYSRGQQLMRIWLERVEK